jgi:hypothetical protein
LGLGGGVYVDSQGNYYPQIYWGSPKLGVSSGYSDDLENFLTGPSVSRTMGRGGVGPNVGTSGSAFGGGFGTKEFGVTYGFGPYNIRNIGESFRPRTDEFGQPFPGNETPGPLPGSNSGNQNAPPASGNPVLKFFDSFRPTTDEFGNPFPGPQSSGGVLKYGAGASLSPEDLARLFPDSVTHPDPASDADAADVRQLVRLA